MNVVQEPFGDSILAKTMVVLVHAAVYIIRLADIKRKILQALKDVDEELFFFHAGYCRQFSNFLGDLEAINQFVRNHM